jgi:hypothetical protein
VRLIGSWVSICSSDGINAKEAGRLQLMNEPLESHELDHAAAEVVKK